ncbi:MAG: hypothetical protein IT198_05480 [Acidimicrobiia bacterium]|nr:hypothetical protein [Acidimicrobiia bacterium]
MVYLRRFLLIACGVLTGAVLLLVCAAPADADGLDLTCSTRTGPVADIDTSTEPEVLDGVDVVFRGRAPASVPITGAVDVDPETGDKLFTRTWRPTSGGTFYVDFLAASGVEMSFLLRPRVHAGWGGPVPFSMGLADLFRENFALPDDFRTNPFLPPDQVGVVGLDVTAFASEALAALPEGIEGRLEAHVRFHRSDGTWTTTRIGVGLDSRAAGADLPRRSDLGVGFKRVWTGGAGTPTDYIVVGQHYTSWTEGTPKPGVGVRVDVDEVLSGPAGETVRPTVDVDLDYSNVPENMAVGVRSRCRPWDPTFSSTGHIAWNHSGLTPEAAAATTMDLRVKTGVEAGLPIRIAEYDPILGGGWRDTLADETDVDATIVGLPERVDWIMHPDSMGITRSTDVTPDVILNHAQLAQDDPLVSDDRPLYVEGAVTGLPAHSRAQAGFAADGSLETLDLQFFEVACTEGAPEDDLFPPGPQGCRRTDRVGIPEAHVLAQNWLPDDLIAQDAWHGMASPPVNEPQYAYYASRDTADGVPVELWRGGARLVGLRQAAFDSSEGGEVRFYVDRDESHVDVPPWSPPGDCIPLPPYWECPPWFPPDPDPAQVVIDVDGRTADDEVVNAGTRVEASGRVPDLPAALRLDVESSAFVTKAMWWATSDVEIDSGLVRATLPGPAATLVDAAFEVGNGGAGLSPAGEVVIEQETVRIPNQVCLIIFGRRICRPTGGSTYQPTGWRHVSFDVPATPDDGFPAVEVPSEVIHAARLKAGVVATTRAGRLGGTRIRAWVDTSLAPGAVVRWNEADGSLAHVEGSFCEEGDECGNFFHGVVVSGPPEIREWERLIDKPALPEAPAAVADVMPAFDDTWLYTDGESGVRAVLAGRDDEWGLNRWGVEAFVESVAAFEYTSEGNDVRVELADGADGTQAFNVDLLDATRRPPVSFGPQYIPLMVDARIDRLPEQMRLRMDASDTSAAADTPWIWVNTEDTGITDAADVDWDTTDAPGTRPRLTGLVRMGYTSMLAGMAGTERPSPVRSAFGADVWAKFASSGPYAVDVVADVEVPRHVAIWKPSLAECNASQSRDRIAACQDRSLYEMDEWQEVRALFKTTSATLGDLNVNARVAGEDSDYGVEGTVGRVPGHLDATVRLTQNRRLPWLEATLALDASAPLGDVQAAVTDRTDPSPAAYRIADGTSRPTPNYAAVLRDVPADLNVSARVFGLEERLTPDLPADSPCRASSGDLGYLHAVLDLGGGVSDVDIDVQETQAGLAADLRADAPVSGWVNARIDDLVFCESDYEDKSSFQIHMADGGVFGSRYAQLVPPVLLFDLILGALGELVLASDADIDVNLDADLPIYFQFDRVTELRVAQNVTTLSVDERHGGEGEPTTIAVRQRSLPHEEPVEVDGAWFRSRDVRFRSTEWGLEDFDIRNNVTDSFAVVGLHPWQRCVDNGDGDSDDDEHPCFTGGYSRDNVGTVADFPTREDRGSEFISADIVIDPVFSPSNRTELQDEDDGLVEPGLIFYGKVAERAVPAEADWFVAPELVASRTRTATPTFTWRPDAWAEYPPFTLASNCSPIAETSDAVGADGTTYGLVPMCAPIVWGYDTPAARAQLFGGFGLTAEFTNGTPRWVVALPDPVGFDPAGNDTCELNLDRNCRVRTRIAPQGNGSVQVTLSTERPFNVFGLRVWRSIGTKYAWLDASGHPAHHLAQAAELPNLFAASFRDANDRSGVTALDPCTIATWACAPPPADHSVQWVFGDGEVSDPSSAAPTPVGHDYPSTRTQQSYYGALVLLDAEGEVAGSAPFIVKAGGWSIFDGSWGWPWPLGG